MVFNPNANFLTIFDREFYLRIHPDVADAGIDPLDHYTQFGFDENRQFSPFFDEEFYLRSNTDVADAGIDPVEHFFNFGLDEGRSPSQFFDTNFYLQQNTDVASAGVNPFQHFLAFGASEGRDPSGFFDASFYLDQNPDVQAASVNPLEHFIEFGIDELRNPNESTNLDTLRQTNTIFGTALNDGDFIVSRKVIKDAFEVVAGGGSVDQAVTIAGISPGDQPSAPPSIDGDDTVSGDDTVGGGSGGGGVSDNTFSVLAMNEAGGTLTISGASIDGVTEMQVNLFGGNVVENTKVVQLQSGSFSNVTALDTSGVTNIPLLLLAVRAGVATTVTGTALADTINGGSAGDIFNGGDDSDVLNGDDGGDTLNGQAGTDSLVGGEGTDTLNGGTGADTLVGGNAADTFVHNGTNEGLDILTDFDATADILSSGLAAGSFTYLTATRRLVSNADNTQGFEFSTAAGASNNTGLDQQEFDVTNAGAGGGKFMSEINDSAGITGSANSDLLIFAGTTAGKTISAGNGDDHLIDFTANANTLNGEAGNDTIMGAGGADTFTGGANADIFVNAFGNGATDGLDIITDFSSADDTLMVNRTANQLEYLVGTNALVRAADNTQGFRFTDAAGADNGTGLDDVNFDESLDGGTGKVMSMVNDAGDLVGSGAGDYLYVSGTTTNRLIDGLGGADVVVDASANGNNFEGGNGADTIDAGAGNDTVNGENANDILTLGTGNDTLIWNNGDDLDRVTDFTGADDTFEFAPAAGSFTYSAGTNSLVLASDANQGVRFTDAAGADNGTGMDDVEFDETNAGGGGKFMSEINNSGNLTGSAAADLLYVSGTTAARTVFGGDGNDRILSDAAGNNTLSGQNDNDTIVSTAGNDTLIGGQGNDALAGNLGDDEFSFEGGAGGQGTVARITTLGLDTISDFTNTGQNDVIGLADADFGLGVGALVNDDEYIETTTVLTGVGQDYSVGADTGLGVLAIEVGGNTQLWFTTAVEAADTTNSVQFATLNGVALTAIDENDFVGA